MKSKFSFLFCLFVMLAAIKIQAQVNIMGKPGYMTTPSAEWFDQKPVGFTFSYVPTEYSLFESPVDKNTINFYNVRASFTSFMEVNLSIAYRPQISDKIGVGDRQLDFRFRLLKEKEYWPAIVIGWTPPGSVSPILAHDYLVATKHFNTSFGKFSTTLGYGSPYVFVKKPEGNFLDLSIEKKDEFLKAKYLTGFYGGFSFMPVNFAGIMMEYDTKTINAGAFIKIKDWLYLQAYTFEAKEIAFTTSVNFSLDFAPKTLRSYEKDLD
ncbi:YjbH domain-containing protein [Gillisia hiemivivida]|nr:YjbH domain-containing protein [Gillisia hiemivivida]